MNRSQSTSENGENQAVNILCDASRCKSKVDGRWSA